MDFSRISSVILFVLLVFSADRTTAQCLDNGNVWNESWVSCLTTACPNPVRGDVHWIQYDLGGLYQITDATLWNLNRAGESGQGAKTIAIDYSVDGSQWATLGEIAIPKANEASNYAGFSGIDFDGEVARYVIVSILENHGAGVCSGFAELKLELEPFAGKPLPIAVKANLEAYFSNFAMHNELEVKGLLPDSQPFDQAPWWYGGTETRSPDLTGVTDWVLLAVLDESGAVLDRRAALIRPDGSVVNPRGNVPVFDVMNFDKLALAIYHKGHLAVVSSDDLAPYALVDFTKPYKTKGTDQTKSIFGIQLLIAGDFDNNGVINNLDYNRWQVDNSSIGVYEHYDADGNGIINNLDYNFWQINRSKIGHGMVQF